MASSAWTSRKGRTRAVSGRPKVTPKAAQRPVAGTSTDYRDRMARDPNYRSKQPDSALTPAQLRQRKLNARLNAYDKDPLYDPSQQLSGRSLVSASRTLAGLEVDPEVKALEREGRSATTQGTALIGHAGDIYRGLAFSDQVAEDKQRALGAMLSAKTTGVADASRAALAAIGPEEAARAAADADVRGSLGADSRVAEQVAHDRAINETVMSQAQTSADRQGADWLALSQAAAQARGMRGGEIQGQLSNRLANTQGQIREKITDAEAKRGPLQTKYLTQLRQQGYENAVTQAGLNIDQSKIDATLKGIEQRNQANIRTTRTSAANNRRTTAATRRGQTLAHEDRQRSNSIASANAAEKNRHNLASEDIAKIKAGTQSEPASARSLRMSVDTVVDEMSGLKSKKGYKRLSGRLAKRTYLQNVIKKRAARAKQKVPPVLLGAATDLAEDGRVSKRNRRILESYGVKVPAEWT